MLNFINKIRYWLGLADINGDGKVDQEDLKIVVDTIKAEANKVVAAKKEAVAEVKNTIKRGRPKKTD